MSASPQAIDLVVFDLGGVLVRLGGIDDMRRLSGIASPEEIIRRWLECRWVRRYESGRCSAGEFAAGVVADWQLPIDAPSFLERFRGWPEALYDGAMELVDEVRAVCAVACLSNTNALHWEVLVDRWDLGSHFDAALLSHDIGMVKPDVAAFRHAASLLERPATRILLLDDSRLNVEGARAAGMHARLVRGPEEARDALVQAGVLAAQRVRAGEDEVRRFPAGRQDRLATREERAGGI